MNLHGKNGGEEQQQPVENKKIQKKTIYSSENFI